MIRTTKRPSHGIVVAYLALFLALAGGAVAAATIGSSDVQNNSLKSADLKNNAGVKGADVRQRSLRGGDLANGTLGGAAAADNSLRGADINEAQLTSTQVITRLGGAINLPVPFAISMVLPNGAYTQAANESNLFISGGQFTFSPACEAPRTATAFLLIDSPAITAESIVGNGQVVDFDTGAVTRQFTFNPIPAATTGPYQFGAAAPVNHQFFIYAQGNCNSGAGITLDSAGIDVIGERG